MFVGTVERDGGENIGTNCSKGPQIQRGSTLHSQVANHLTVGLLSFCNPLAT